MLASVDPSSKNPVLFIGLDGFDIELCQRLVPQGYMPNFAKLYGRSARYVLDHGRDKYSGLAWEHFSTGVAPRDGGRWSAVRFEPQTYSAKQAPTSTAPFLARLASATVVFDLPYCDMNLAPNVRGLTGWGAHDPGVDPAARPHGLHDELRQRFGPYPAPESIYGFCWPSAAKTRSLAQELARAVEVRSRAAQWLLGERLPNWELAIVVVSETHSATEPLWHGLDVSHPLHGAESAAAAGEGLCKVYRQIDRLIGDLQEACPDATLVLFAAHGMGPNNADVAAMALLPELLYRFAFGVPYLRSRDWPDRLPDGTPLLAQDDNWDWVMHEAVPLPAPASLAASILRQSNLSWMPAWRYSPFWRRMPAFALPSFYDGRVRLNVKDRESNGIVPQHQYGNACRQIISLLHDCRNLLTGEPAVAEVYQPKDNPNNVGSSEADLYVLWQNQVLGLRCPKHGDIGPLPYRRTGGHTGSSGFLAIAGGGISAGSYGIASTFDVVPTLVDLLGQTPLPEITGNSLVSDYASVT